MRGPARRASALDLRAKRVYTNSTVPLPNGERLIQSEHLMENRR